MIINVVLVRTIYPSNIGSTARAIGNMGADRLILVNPQCEVDFKARSSAAGAQQWLLGRTVYGSMEEFYKAEGEGMRIGLTRRSGKLRTTSPLVKIVSQLKKQKTKPKAIYLFFGPEDNGLDADEIDLMNFCCSLPVPGEFKSLNLSHSVLLTIHVINALKSKTKTGKIPIEPLYFPEETIKNWIHAMGFDWKKRRSSALNTVKKVLLRSTASQRDIKNLEAIFKQSTRKMSQKREID